MRNLSHIHVESLAQILVRATACLAAVLLTFAAAAASPNISLEDGSIENFFIAADEHNKISADRNLTYATADVALFPSTSVTVGLLNYDGSTDLDENYVQYDSGNTRVRAGRIRSEFGFSDWSELYYQGFIQQPLVRTDQIAPGIALDRVDSGAEWKQTFGPTQITAALIDAQSGGYELLPRQVNHADIRVQRSVGPLIFGANALVATRGTANVYGVDVRWTAPHVQVRAEFDTAGNIHPTPSGYYVDVLFHPPGLLRTTFIARAEGVFNVQSYDYGYAPHGSWAVSGHQYTLGVKQILSPQYTLEFSKFYGNGEAHDAPDWAIQLITFTRF